MNLENVMKKACFLLTEILFIQLLIIFFDIIKPISWLNTRKYKKIAIENAYDTAHSVYEFQKRYRQNNSKYLDLGEIRDAMYCSPYVIIHWSPDATIFSNVRNSSKEMRLEKINIQPDSFTIGISTKEGWNTTIVYVNDKGQIWQEEINW